MTSLRSFQNEIDSIHHREVAKKRAQTLAEREKDKDVKKSAAKPAVKVAEAQPVSEDAQDDDEASVLANVEEKVQVCGDTLPSRACPLTFAGNSHYFCPVTETRRAT